MGQRSPTTDSPSRRSPLVSPSQPTPKATHTLKSDPMSLAAFMGSRAAGPRLNKHAPQQDAHDTTRFNWPEKTSAPHPIFGKGGVAMPGMSSTVAEPSVTESRNPTSTRAELPLSPSTERQRRNSTPFVARRHIKKVEEKVEKNDYTAQGTKVSVPEGNILERKMSTPAGLGVPRYQTPPNFLAESRLLRSPAHISTPEIRSTLATTSPLVSSPQPLTSSTSLASTPRKSPTVTQALTRSAQPSPNASQGPQLVSSMPSPAFHKPTPQKEVTPSLSRLQGRGFVRNMVKVSSQFEAAVTSTSRSTPQTPEKRATSDAKKPIPVLDRWQSNSVAAQPLRTPSPAAMRKTKSTDLSSLPAMTSTTVATPPKPAQSSIIKRKSQNFITSNDGQKLVARSPHQSVAEPAIGKRSPVESNDRSTALTSGLGSSNTLMSYIKPIKTGDSPSPDASRPKTPLEMVRIKESLPSKGGPVADETRVRKKSLGGMRDNDRNSALASPTVLEVSSVGNPLSHVRHHW
jgi:hypothetical protein